MDNDNKQEDLYYVNRKGNKIPVGITKHALSRFKERWSLLSGYAPPEDDAEVECMMHDQFMRSERIEQYTKKDKDRMKKYRGGSLYFRRNSIIFVVQDGSIVTVEIGGKKRRLNKKKGKEAVSAG